MRKKYYKILKIVIILSILYPVNCFADFNWKKMGSNSKGDVFYIDLLSIKKVGNKVFYFTLTDYIKPTSLGDLSSKVYGEVNCLNFSFRYLKDFYYQQPMANGEPSTVFDEVSEWIENKKGSMFEILNKFACNYK